ncbi:MAG: dihydropteroate synthase [Pyrinomonadaceae bacterium]
MAGPSWKTSKREFNLEGRPLVTGILNVTPDSFSDGGRFLSADRAFKQAEKMISEGADILDVGGESTRPGGSPVSSKAELERVLPVVEAISREFDVAISIDTTKSEVARRSIDAGAEIINDISGLRFDPSIADVARETGAGLVLMHSRGTFETMHTQPPVDDIVADVTADFRRSISAARDRGVADPQIVLDVGLGFGKSFEQNLELLAKLGKIVDEFDDYPMLVGASRKSFIGKILGDVPPEDRLGGSLAAAVLAAANGASILRVHDVKATVQAMRVASEYRKRYAKT